MLFLFLSLESPFFLLAERLPLTGRRQIIWMIERTGHGRVHGEANLPPLAVRGGAIVLTQLVESFGQGGLDRL